MLPTLFAGRDKSAWSGSHLVIGQSLFTLATFHWLMEIVLTNLVPSVYALLPKDITGHNRDIHQHMSKLRTAF